MARVGFILSVLALMSVSAADWSQFRGPNSSGIADGNPDLPVEFGPGTNVVWKTALPPGHSSPTIGNDSIFVTAVENDKLYSISVDRATGRIKWRREAPRPRKQVIERPANSPVSATPVTDGRNVFAFFQDFGLIAYGPDGGELWRVPLGPFNNPFGHGASPILAGDTLLMNCDQDTGSFLLAVDKNTGKTLWRTERPHAQRGYATPVLYAPKDGARQVIVAGSFRLSGYAVKTGKEAWYIRRLPWQIKPTPVVSGDVVYFTTFSGESEPGEQEIVPPFQDALAKLDKNGDGKLSKEEIVDPKVKARFDEYLDLDDSGFLEEHDWKQLQERRLGENAVRAYRIGGAQGDITDTHQLWKSSKSLPNVPSPLVYQGIVYLLKEGGIFTSYDAKTGETLKQARLAGAPGDYYASPIAADGRIYAISEEGKVVVLAAGGQWQITRINTLDDECKATPAVADNKLYVRTRSALYCFATGKAR
ncbi:MAG: PQQ-binding-like beta-propeller repeat protein [Bryobacteraceae bacterium]|nr:PQQ-binding-like beta-propeller repeat protein [Bryobacteraceae bacterium]